MAKKVTFNKLNLEKNNEVTVLHHGDYDITVKAYLPIQDKLKLIEEVIVAAHDQSVNFVNPLQVSAILGVKIVEYYTDVQFTSKQREDYAKTYDLLVGSDFLTEVQMAIPTSELKILMNGVWDTIDSVYKYRNSILGLLDIVSNDYKSTELDLQKILDSITDSSDEITTLREIMGISNGAMDGTLDAGLK